MSEHRKHLVSGIKKIADFIYPELEIVGVENLPEEPAVLVGNHCQIHGPIVSQIRIPGKNYTWCAGQMMHKDEVADYAYQDFWSYKPKYARPFYKVLSHAIVPLSVFIFNHADTVPVYHDIRLTKTFRESVRHLQEGSNLIIFPEYLEKYNQILYRFQEKFVDVARFYYKQTGKSLLFVPMYLAPKLKKLVVGHSIRFDPTAPIEEERQRICAYLMDTITDMAAALPRHKVIPYANVSKREYPDNVPMEVTAHEAQSV